MTDLSIRVHTASSFPYISFAYRHDQLVVGLVINYFKQLISIRLIEGVGIVLLTMMSKFKLQLFLIRIIIWYMIVF